MRTSSLQGSRAFIPALVALLLVYSPASFSQTTPAKPTPPKKAGELPSVLNPDVDDAEFFEAQRNRKNRRRAKQNKETISITALDARTRKPIKNGRMRMYNMHTHPISSWKNLSSDGHIQFTRSKHSSGIHKVEIEGEGLRSLLINIWGGQQEEITLVLHPVGDHTLQVLNPDQSPARNVRVYARPAQERNHWGDSLILKAHQLSKQFPAGSEEWEEEIGAAEYYRVTDQDGKTQILLDRPIIQENPGVNEDGADSSELNWVAAAPEGFGGVSTEASETVSTLQLFPWCSVAGRMTRNGRALANQQVILCTHPDHVAGFQSGFTRSAETDSEGRFAFHSVPPGPSVLLPTLPAEERQPAGSWVSGQPLVTTLRAGRTNTIDLKPESVRLRGTLQLPEGTKEEGPYALTLRGEGEVQGTRSIGLAFRGSGATISHSSLDQSATQRRVHRSDSLEFTFADVPPGAYALQVTIDHHNPPKSFKARIIVDPAKADKQGALDVGALKLANQDPFRGGFPGQDAPQTQ